MKRYRYSRIVKVVQYFSPLIEAENELEAEMRRITLMEKGQLTLFDSEVLTNLSNSIFTEVKEN